MRKSNNAASAGCAWLLVIGGVIYLFANYSSLMVTGLAILFIGALIAAFMKKTNCTVCGNRFSRNYYTWNIEGRTEHVCTHCNQNLQRRNSRDAMRNRP